MQPTVLPLVWRSSLLSIGVTVIFSLPVQANCADFISELEDVQPAMERLWQQVQQQTTYPWGQARPYAQLGEGRITLTPIFDRLTGTQKRQVLAQLRLENWAVELLTPEEAAKIRKVYSNAIPAAMSPYQVFASDGRAVSMPYDGCTRLTLLTERDRFSWYTNRPVATATPETLRNAGTPSWRKVKFAIAPAPEKTIRLKFWQTVGYDKYPLGWWIAWVPEQGQFEITVATNQPYQNTLQKFWQVAPRQYRYQVITTEGTMLETDKLNPQKGLDS
ncbi:MAG: hypothetical protein KME16_26185 [Scytolyngbya sp. HA4215-MV1]|nr:hypothetical protein [Scytolyngbya sp. HA4215-MV1]